MVKVGDKIRILIDGADYASVMRGDEFVVSEVFGEEAIEVAGENNWIFSSCSYEVIHTTPPKKITKNGYEYSLVGPVKPDWLVDGAWVVRKDNGCKHQVVLNKNGLLVLTMPGTDATILPNHHIYDQYRPHTSSDWKWGDWALYRGKRVFVMGSDGDSVKISHPRLSVAGFACEWISFQDLTPTF